MMAKYTKVKCISITMNLFYLFQHQQKKKKKTFITSELIFPLFKKKEIFFIFVVKNLLSLKMRKLFSSKVKFNQQNHPIDKSGLKQSNIKRIN